MQSRCFVYPGTFDPLTLGHIDIIERALMLCETLIIAVAKDSTVKTPLLPALKRAELITEVFKNHQRIIVKEMEGLLVDFMMRETAQVVVRGIRNAKDMDYEMEMAGMNARLAPTAECIFLPARDAHRSISSTLVRVVATNGGDISHFVPPVVADALQSHFSMKG